MATASVFPQGINTAFFASKKSFTIHVRTKASCTKITRILPDGIIAMDIAAVPEHNKANLEIMKFFSKHMGMRVSIILSKKSKGKVLRIVKS